MGLVLSRLWSLFFRFEEHKIIMVGLNNAGKTTTLYKLLLNEVVVTAPTIGSNVEELVYKNLRFVIWDIGGQESSRLAWEAYFPSAKAVIMVIDSSDKERISIVRDELDKLINHESLRGAMLLVFANKQDLKGSLSSAELSDILKLHSIKERPWHIQVCCCDIFLSSGLNP
eukprot:TRINITY_DN8824_c0_g1_i1.p1 TRINITY_DN8824_c0_g1~~TRINITY_DN8824_c0_g1_i1.p1  ORF type:complete len:182 (-),score=14.63 TRINITY_DN8824_c0_g1_i1:839-1351(-)